jgi:transcriptional regulator NrdR family protein
MKCPFCGCDDTQVKDSRNADDNTAIRRRRECPECGSRFTTFERVQLRELIVVKKNGEKVRKTWLQLPYKQLSLSDLGKIFVKNLQK